VLSLKKKSTGITSPFALHLFHFPKRVTYPDSLPLLHLITLIIFDVHQIMTRAFAYMGVRQSYW